MPLDRVRFVLNWREHGVKRAKMLRSQHSPYLDTCADDKADRFRRRMDADVLRKP